jgi:menaquinone-dependent protoporphyrinogen IX oxidase
MRAIIIYGTQYGTSRKYADRLSELTGIESVDYSDVKEKSTYDKVFYVGSLYAGGVKGLKQTVKKLPANTEYVIITVGLADPEDPENVSNIRASVRKQVPEELFPKIKFFHLRGSIDYKRLNFKHRTMMAMLYRQVKKRPEDQLKAEDKMMLETYNQVVDFVDYNSLDPIVDLIHQTDLG